VRPAAALPAFPRRRAAVGAIPPRDRRPHQHRGGAVMHEARRRP
jgi:hypothetical protein